MEMVFIMKMGPLKESYRKWGHTMRIGAYRIEG